MNIDLRFGADWQRTLNRLSVAHRGELATITVHQDRFGTRVEASSLPLAGITADSKDGECGIAIILRNVDGTHLTHFVFDPQAVHIDDRPEDGSLTMSILDNQGTSSLLELRKPAAVAAV